MIEYIYIFGSVIVVSLMALVAFIPFLFHKKVPHKLLMFLLSLSVGTMLGSVFIHFLPETVEHGYSLLTAIYILLGFLVFFVLEKFIHWHHNKCEHKNHEHGEGHSHAYHLAPLNLIGDGVHNFLDGLVIAGAYLVSIPLGVAATISVLFHELPQEIADFGVLLYSGFSKKKAVVFNLLSALTAVVGAIIAVFLTSKIHGFSSFIIPFAAGTFLYIAASNLVPELHRHCKIKDTFIHILSIVLGVALMASIVLLE